MAMSGTISRTVATNWYVQLEWSAVHNVSANSSTITTRLYWGGAYAVQSSTTKTATSTVAGTSRSDNFTAGIYAGQKKLIQTETWTVSHNTDGTKSVSIGFNATLGLTLSGTYVASASNSATVTLDPIVLRSTGYIAGNYTVPQDVYYYINAANTTMRHTVELILSYGGHSEVIATRTQVAGGSHSFGLSVAEMKKISNYCRRNSTYFAAVSKIRITTYTSSSGSQIGSPFTQTTYTEINQPAATVATVTGSSGSTIRISDTITVGLAGRASPSFVHWIELSASPTFSTENRIFFTTTSSTSYVIGLNRSEIIAEMGSASSKTFYIRTHTFYSDTDGVNTSTNKIRGMTVTSFTISSNRPPIWNTTSTMVYAESPSTSSVTTITGSNQILVKGKSTARVYLPTSPASGQDGATIASYVFSLGTFSRTWTPSTYPLYVDVPITSLSSVSTAYLHAIDSRGNSTETYKTVSVRIYNYTNPTISRITASRTSGTSVALTAEGTHSPLNGGANIISTVLWSNSSTSFPTGQSMSVTSRPSGTWNTSTTTVTQPTDVGRYYYFRAIDRFGTIVTSGFVYVAPVQPIIVIDAVNRRLGINKETASYTLDVRGDALIDGSLLTNDIMSWGNISAVGTLHASSSTGGSYITGNTLTSGPMLNLYTTGTSTATNELLKITANKRVTNGVAMIETMINQSRPMLTINGYQDSATLLIDSVPSNYSSRIGFAKQGVETGYLERYYSGDQMRLHSNTTLRLSATNGIILNNNVDINGEAVFNAIPYTSALEIGYCGMSGAAPGRNANNHLMGYGVNFKMAKNYTPSSVTFSLLDRSPTTLSANATQISPYGFFFYIMSTTNTTSGTFLYWRGHYAC